MDRNPIIASENMILTNGKTYGKKIYLVEGIDTSSYHEITIEEYKKRMAEQESEAE